MTDSDLDFSPPQVAHQHGLPPARLPTVEDTHTYWTLPAVVAWILARDLCAVDALCQPLPAVNKGAILLAARAEASIGGKPPIFLRFRLKPIRDARRELIHNLAAEKVAAYGDRGNGFEPIPVVEFSRALGPFEDGADRVGPYRDVKIARTEVLQRWPDPSAAIQDEPARLDSGKRANGVDVQQESESSVTVGSDDGLRTEIGAWYGTGWVPACQTFDFVPTRDHECKAARRVFGDRLRGFDLRRLVGQARGDHAPRYWTKRGPKGLDRKSTDYRDLLESAIGKSIEFWRPE